MTYLSITKRDLKPDHVMPKMRTTATPGRPTIHNDFGSYSSKTFWYPVGFISCSIELDVYWVNGMGWHTSIMLESNLKEPRAGRKQFEIDFGKIDPNPYWCGGDLLPLAAEYADRRAKVLITELRGLKMPALAPYVQKVKNEYGDKYIPDYQKYLDDGIALNPIPFV